jgi:UDP-N-acetylmuramoyl-L-alanyl-D-glutamate--2,6-diaminopimelate ligase
VTSDHPRTEVPEAVIAQVLAGIPPGTDLRVAPDRRRAISQAVADAGEGDLILVAGKGHEPYQEIHGVKHPFDDLCEVRTAMGLESG